MPDIYLVRVLHLRGKYPAATYDDVQAESPIAAEMAGLERYIAENKHPPRRAKERGSAYYGRFWVEARIAISGPETATP